jgi:hypothetical protein
MSDRIRHTTASAIPSPCRAAGRVPAAQRARTTGRDTWTRRARRPGAAHAGTA